MNRQTPRCAVLGRLDTVEQVQREIDVWHAYLEFYGYEFFVMRAD